MAIQRLRLLAFAFLLVSCAVAEPPPQPTAPVVVATEPLLQGFGTYHHPITTLSRPAQTYFDQGLRLAYASEPDAAKRSFEQAARLDPAAAMPLWGIALVLEPDLDRTANPHAEATNRKLAREALRRARELAHNGTDAERDSIEALAVRDADTPGEAPDARRLAYVEAMRSLAHRYPDDLDVATLFASAMLRARAPADLWAADGSPLGDAREIEATLDYVLARDADHPGANHLYVHVLEASPHPERAVANAERIGRLMPGAPHFVHVAAHVFMRVGRYADATNAELSAADLDRAYASLRGVPGAGASSVAADAHNLQSLAVSASMEGSSRVAFDAARAAVALGGDAFGASALYAFVRFGRWDLVLALPEPAPELGYVTGVWHAARGLAFAHAGREGEAVNELAEVARVRGALAEDAMVGTNHAATLLQVAASLLEGEIEAKRGAPDEAVRRLEEAVAAEDGLRYDAPAAFPLPVRDWLGAMLLEQGRSAEAEMVYRDDLARHPSSGWALFGLEQSLAASGRGELAAAVHAQFVQAFRRADVALSASRF